MHGRLKMGPQVSVKIFPILRKLLAQEIFLCNSSENESSNQTLHLLRWEG